MQQNIVRCGNWLLDDNRSCPNDADQTRRGGDAVQPDDRCNGQVTGILHGETVRSSSSSKVRHRDVE